MGAAMEAALRVALTVVGTTLVALGWPTAPAQAQIAVVVNKSNPITDLTLSELARLYLGRQTTFGSRARVALGEYRPVRRAFYQTVLRMTPTAVRRHWIGVVFSEQDATPPREFRNLEDLRRFMTSTPGAICFLDLASVNDDVKVLTIDGMRPQHPGYPLR